MHKLWAKSVCCLFHHPKNLGPNFVPNSANLAQNLCQIRKILYALLIHNATKCFPTCNYFSQSVSAQNRENEFQILVRNELKMYYNTLKP